jgi:alpha-L-rhamnosidase
MRFPIFAILVASLITSALALPPTALRCENRVDPLGVEAATPRLSWQLQAAPGQTNQSQSAYRILVASSEANLAADTGDLWDSGKVTSSQSRAIRYAGPALTSEQKLHWKVRVWDQADQSTDWSAPATWTMGLLESSDWHGASWMGAADTSISQGYAVESATEDAVKWVQVDLGSDTALDSVLIRPQFHNDAGAGGWIPGYGFPLRFKVEVSNVADFSTSTVIADQTGGDFANPGHTTLSLPASGATARFIRFTATKLWQRGAGLNYVFTLAEIEAISGATNVALNKAVSANDSYEGSGWSKNHLTNGKYQQALPPALLDNPSAAILLRKEFSIAKPVKRALAAIGTVGYSELTLNGTKAGDAQLSPEYTDYRKRVPYVIHDVTSTVAQGANALGLSLAHGFASTPGGGYLGWYGRSAPPRVLFRLLVEFTDGTSQTIISDGSWKWNIGENTFNDLWVGEKIDKRLAKNGWNLTGYDDSAWFATNLLPNPGGTLFARTIAPVKVLETVSPTSIDGNLFHFDHLATGWLRLKTSGSAGQTVSVLQRGDFSSAFGQTSFPEGPQVGMQCTLSGNGEETFEPKWFFHTISKTVRVEGLTQPATPDTLTRVSVGIDLPRAGNFECSNAFLNEQYQSLLRTQRNYNFDYPLDPSREKTGWSQDVMGMIHSSVYDFDSEEFYWNWWQSMRDTQQAGGYLDPVMPQIDIAVPGYNGPWWAGMIVYTPWHLYHYYGDRKYIEESYPAMKSFMDYLATQADTDKVISWGLGDWIEVGSISNPTRTAVPITSTCAYYLYATILHRSAELLGNTSDAATYAALATEIKDGFNRRFLNATTGQVGAVADTQTAQILPLYLGMIPEDKKQLVLDRLVANIHERGDHVSTGFVGTIHLLLGLPDLGQAQLTHRMVTQLDYPGWNTLVQNGVQMETWNGGQVQMPSLGGPIGAYLYQILGGIRPAEPGFKKVLIKPAMVGDLTFVNTHHDGPYGRITSNWRKENDQFILDAVIPPNSTATVVLPNGASHEVGSGTYQWVIELPVPPRTSQLLLEDDFDSVSESAAGFNNTLAADQGGSLKPVSYTVTTAGQDWQAQHGNTAAMLLVGDNGYAATAALNRDFSASANEFDLPIAFQMDARVTDTTVPSCWSSICIGSARNITANDNRARFGFLPVLNGSLQVWIDGVKQLPDTSHAGNSFRVVLSNTAGNGSAFNGNGSKATLYDGATPIGTYTLPQLGAGDGYLSFSANPYNGSWNLTRIDNLRIELVSDYDAWSSSLGLTEGPAGDDDQDGHSNLDEYAFGLDPRSGASIQPFSNFPAPSTGTFTYTRRKRTLSGMDFTIWTSTSLTDWTQDTGAEQNTEAIPGTDKETVEVSLSPALRSESRLFLRISAQSS